MTWTYLVTNTGTEPLTNVVVGDDRGVAVSCSGQTTLAAGQSMTCTGTGVATAGQYTNIGTVTATAPSGQVTDSDASHYYGQAAAWIQPTTNVPSGAKISTVVNVRIEKDGHVSKFEIAEPSANATVNESVAAVAKQISQVDPPPTGLIKGDHYDVKINFELNTEEKQEN